MLESLLIIFMIALLPTLLSLLLLRRAEAQARARVQSAMNATTQRGLRRFHTALSSDYRYVEGMGYLIGDITCRFNARSAYIRCAVNPAGPCQGCSCYESIDLQDSLLKDSIKD